MGARARLKSSFDCTANMVTQAARIICTAMKKYGLILADNGELPTPGVRPKGVFSTAAGALRATSLDGLMWLPVVSEPCTSNANIHNPLHVPQ